MVLHDLVPGYGIANEIVELSVWPKSDLQRMQRRPSVIAIEPNSRAVVPALIANEIGERHLVAHGVECEDRAVLDFVENLHEVEEVSGCRYRCGEVLLPCEGVTRSGGIAVSAEFHTLPR